MFLREVFQCSVLICFWRVRHAWHKNLIKRCPESETRAQISRRLGQSVYNICSGSGTMDLFDDFMEDFVDASDFIDYFKAVWYPRIGKTNTLFEIRNFRFRNNLHNICIFQPTYLLPQSASVEIKKFIVQRDGQNRLMENNLENNGRIDRGRRRRPHATAHMP